MTNEKPLERGLGGKNDSSPDKDTPPHRLGFQGPVVLSRMLHPEGHLARFSPSPGAGWVEAQARHASPWLVHHRRHQFQGVQQNPECSHLHGTLDQLAQKVPHTLGFTDE